MLCTSVIGLAVVLLNLVAFAFHFDMARKVGLAGTGFNAVCQASALTTLDRSVCEEDRLSHLFLIYTDGSPFLFYEALLSVPRYRDISVAKVSENPGIADSGPSFRSSLIGRFDTDYVSDLRQLDNHLHQFLRNTGSPMELELFFHFPVLPTLSPRFCSAPTTPTASRSSVQSSSSTTPSPATSAALTRSPASSSPKQQQLDSSK